MEFTKIRLSRSGCFGTCPVYTITIHSTGKVFWEGEFFVKVVGKADWVLTQGKISEIEKLIDTFRYFELCQNESLEEYLTDMPGCSITVELKGGRSKTIDHDLGDSSWSEELARFEDEIDRIAGTEQYIGTESDWMH